MVREVNPLRRAPGIAFQVLIATTKCLVILF